MIDLDSIKIREAKASRGPWVYERLEIHERARSIDGPTDMHQIVDHTVAGQKPIDQFMHYVCGLASTRGKYEREEANGKFIAHARQDIPDLIAEVERLRDAIRIHRDARGDDRCWMDDEELYKTLPEGYTPPVRDSTVELAYCQQFIASRQNPAIIYVSPERVIELLRAEIAKLKQGE